MPGLRLHRRFGGETLVSNNQNRSLLLVLHVPYRLGEDGELLVEAQACQGLERWAENFPRLVVACPLQPASLASESGTADYRPFASLPSRHRIEPVLLPWAYALSDFAWHYSRTRRILGELIRRTDYLTFAIGGLVGNWPGVAALEAISQQRKFSVSTDRVEHRVVRVSRPGHKGVFSRLRSCKNRYIIGPLMERFERHLIAHCSVGLFHGGDCFEAYSPFCRTPNLVYNIGLGEEDRIPADELKTKIERIGTDAPLKLVYAGRADTMKGPLDWIEVMANLRDRGIDFTATWLGDGPLTPALHAEVHRLGLEDRVKLSGFVADRAEVLSAVRQADLVVFCHKTPESPRCLIEALMLGTPMAGYDSPFPRALLGNQASELLVPRDDIQSLADQIARLSRNRPALAELTERCATLGKNFSDRQAFRHRSNLIKRYLDPRDDDREGLHLDLFRAWRIEGTLRPGFYQPNSRLFNQLASEVAEGQ